MAFLTRGLRIILRDNRQEDAANNEVVIGSEADLDGENTDSEAIADIEDTDNAAAIKDEAVKAHEKAQISELLERADADIREQAAEEGKDQNFKEVLSFSEENATVEEYKNARTGGRIGHVHTVTLEDGRKQKIIEFYYEGGIKEFVTYLNKSKAPLYDNILYFEGQKNGVYVEAQRLI